jgi:hypothetical protein
VNTAVVKGTLGDTTRFGCWVLERTCDAMSPRTLRHDVRETLRVACARGVIALSYPFFSKSDRLLARAIWREGRFFSFTTFLHTEFPLDFDVLETDEDHAAI